MKEKLIRKKLILSIFVFCILCMFLLGSHIYPSQKSDTPPQDTDGYYLLYTKEDFRWFTKTVRDIDKNVNVRLAEDLILNDTDNWENWADTCPDNTYSPIAYYNGHFDGNGHALIGYHARSETWFAAIFTSLGENARISDLTLRDCSFQTTLEDSIYEDTDGLTNVIIASSLCFANSGTIENCDVHANVSGAWSAGGIAAINYGQMINCRFTGTVEAGSDQSTQPPEGSLAVDTLYAGGICRSNQGILKNCVNDGTITLHTLADSYYVYNYAAGGIAGQALTGSMIQDSHNTGSVTSVQLAGGIAGSSRGTISKCTNSGNILIEQADWDHTSSLISAGICASNGGDVDTCVNTGNVSIHQTYLSFYAPIYGIACNTVNPSKGTTTNCYYLKDGALQDCRQSGVYKLSAADTADLPAYLAGEKRITDVDTWNLLTTLPGYPGTDEDDYIHLSFGPEQDVEYEVLPGDTLWNIAEKFYADGRFHDLLIQDKTSPTPHHLIPGERIIVPHKDYYLLCANDEAGFKWSSCILPSGESCPTRFAAVKPINWYYGSMDFAANAGMDTMWPKDLELGNDAAAADIRIFCRLDANPEGDFFADDWPGVQDRIRQSAEACCGSSIDSLRFYHYGLDSGDDLYGFSFRLHRPDGTLKCAAFYRLCDGILAEFIGVEPVTEEEHVLERVRYLAARVDSTIEIEEAQYEPEEFFGRDNWAFPQLHNPFAIAQEYSKDAECYSYMLFTGSQ